MNYSPRQLFSHLTFGIATAVLASCGGGGESAADSGDKWFAAWNVEQAYAAQIRMDALNTGGQPFEADTSCKAILPMAEKSLSDTSNTGTFVQLMYKTCNDAGLKFQSKARCEAERLQVLCR